MSATRLSAKNQRVVDKESSGLVDGVGTENETSDNKDSEVNEVENNNTKNQKGNFLSVAEDITLGKTNNTNRVHFYDKAIKINKSYITNYESHFLDISVLDRESDITNKVCFVLSCEIKMGKSVTRAEIEVMDLAGRTIRTVMFGPEYSDTKFLRDHLLGKVVNIRSGKVGEFRGTLNISLSDDLDVIDSISPEKFPYKEPDLKKYHDLIKEVISKIEDETLRKLIDHIYHERRFIEILESGRVTNPKARIGSLLRVTAQKSFIAYTIASMTKNVDTDLVIAGSLLRDLGTTAGYNPEQNDFTIQGKCIGINSIAYLIFNNMLNESGIVINQKQKYTLSNIMVKGDSTKENTKKSIKTPECSLIIEVEESIINSYIREVSYPTIRKGNNSFLGNSLNIIRL